MDRQRLEADRPRLGIGRVKVAVSRRGEFKHCIFYRNGGTGALVRHRLPRHPSRDCTFAENELSGLFIEISQGIHAEHNTVLRNAIETVGHVSDNDWSCGGIQIGESENCVIENNLCIDNKDGITLREIGPRDVKTHGEKSIDHVANNRIENNTIAQSRGYAIALWWDNAFLARILRKRISSNRPMRGNCRTRDIHNRVFDPLAAESGDRQRHLLRRRGISLWRALAIGAKKLATLDEFCPTIGFEKSGRIADQSISPPDLPKQIDPFEAKP